MQRRTSSVVQRDIQGRPSFRAILALAGSLDDLRDGHTSSPEFIANYFLRRSQDSLNARLTELQRLQRIGFRKMTTLLCFSSDCSWKASLLCGSLYKKLLIANLSIARMQAILEAPSPGHNQVVDLLCSLTDLRNLFSKDTLEEIDKATDLFSKLHIAIESYQHRHRVRALSRMSALNRRAHYGVARSRLAMRAFKASIASRISMCSTSAMISDGSNSEREEPMTQQMHRDGVDEEPLAHGMSLNGTSKTSSSDFDAGAVVPHSGLHTGIQNPAVSGFTGFTPLLRLYTLKKRMYAINKTFETLRPMVDYTVLNERYIEILKNDPLLFDLVVELIRDRHASWRTDLNNLREQLLQTFCFINCARDLVYVM